MSDNRKYYYLKLKENYFDEDAIVLLESMQDGILYSNILLKLYLKSLKYGGTLQLDENIPYTAQMIATITRQQVGTVERALQIFMKLGLVEPLDNGALYMSNIELFIGQSSTEGERKRRARMKISEQKRLSGQVSEAKADICPPEIEIKKEIDIDVYKRQDRNGTPRYAHVRGTADSFRQDVAGSDKSYPFRYEGNGDQLFVFEAPIDLLSFICLYPQDWQTRNYLALGGVSGKALDRFLSRCV